MVEVPQLLRTVMFDVLSSVQHGLSMYVGFAVGGRMPLLIVGGFWSTVIAGHVASKVHWVLKGLWDVLLQPRR